MASIGEDGIEKFDQHTIGKAIKSPAFSAREHNQARECILEYHSCIEPLLFESASRTLQKEDSEIALGVLRILMERDVPVIPVHESFIVKRKDIEILRDAMQMALPNCYIH